MTRSSFPTSTSATRDVSGTGVTLRKLGDNFKQDTCPLTRSIHIKILNRGRAVRNNLPIVTDHDDRMMRWESHACQFRTSLCHDSLTTERLVQTNVQVVNSDPSFRDHATENGRTVWRPTCVFDSTTKVQNHKRIPRLYGSQLSRWKCQKDSTDYFSRSSQILTSQSAPHVRKTCGWKGFHSTV